MKKLIVLFIPVILFILACGQETGEPRYTPDTPQYTFFKDVANKVPSLNPDKSVFLISTDKFKIGTADVMPMVYQAFQQYANQIDNLNIEEVNKVMREVAIKIGTDKLLVLAAQEQSVEIPEDTVQAELQKFYTKFGSKENFEQQLQRQGFTMEFVQSDIKNGMLIRKYFNEIVYPSITVTENDIDEAYKQDKLATVRHILMLTQGKGEEEKAAIRVKMEEILEKAQAGEDFSELAKQYTEDPGSKDTGGLYEDFPRGRMVKPFEDASFDLPIGSISDIVETRYGFHIIKVEGRKKETLPLEEVRDDLEKQITLLKQRDRYTSEIESLKEEYHYKELF